MLEKNDLEKCYRKTYYSYQNFRMNESKTLLQKIYDKVTRIKTYTPNLPKNAEILDVGCGSGAWLWEMKQKGYNVQGCEVSNEAALFWKKIADIDIFAGELIDSHFEEKSFDFIRLNHSFEHINNPHETLQKIRKYLKDEGQLFIGVPNTAGLWSKIFKKNWYYLGAPIHVYNYSVKNLEYILKRNGFEIVEVHYNGNYYGLIGSFQIYLNEKKKSYLKVEVGKIASNKLLRVISYGISIIVNKLKMGDCIEVIAKKIEF